MLMTSEPPAKVRYRQARGGRKMSVPEVREAMYDWFIDIRSSMKASAVYVQSAV